MTSGMTALLAVGGTSLICYFLMNRRARREGTGGDSSGIGAGYNSDSGSWNVLSRFGSDHSSSDNSAASGGWSGSDGGGGGGDSGGGGDGGGGD